MIESTNRLLKSRKKRNSFFFFTVFAISMLTFIPLFLLISFIVYKGVSNFSLNLITDGFPFASNEVTGEGGILPAIVGSFLIIFIAFIISTPLGVLIGLSISNNPHSRLSKLTVLASDIIQGIPAVVIGLIAYYWFVYPTKQFSSLSASIAFSLIMLPIIIASTTQAIQNIPNHLHEASYALGATHIKTTFSILLPISIPAIINATILSISRVIGESAPLLFTSFGSSVLQLNPMERSSAIALIIFQYANSPFLNQQQLAWNASLLLIIIVLSLNIISKITYKKLKVHL